MTLRRFLSLTRNGPKGLLVAVALSSGLAACAEDDAAPAEPPARPAKLFEVEETLNARTTNFPAVIKARSSAELTFEVGGVLEVFPVSEGQQVAKDELIAQLEQRSFENDVAQAEAQYRNAQAQFNRAAQLIDKGTIARSTYDTRLKDRDVAKTALDNARKRLEDSTMRAPFDGVIATKHVDQFQTIAPQTPIVTIQSTGAAEAVVQIPSRLVANSNQIQPIETVVILDAAPDTPIPASIVSTSTRTDPRTQTFEVSFAFEPPEELTILPGMTGTLRASLAINGRDGESHMPIPRTAVLPRGETLYVWKVDPDTMTVSQQAIETGPWLEEGIPVTGGLEPGDIIVEAGVSYLAEGMKVRPYGQ
ncbi:efflux RND transporter periplasmic adaptor subunit [Pyruvatibacter mobilis]|uniref:Efflux RND transporter periplasmic adaptor subunit n=1 Tax=Pyruvatibacter mobilis TaxID=1712261 RepID=A0A845QCD5_9HYPH|nr:efflux RND transporter periplasmic adaptor subunit [Pyruvatibacter mobilis]NBG96079.1 efflux RND transporter periplasmic adaptor subunit [Pyruvatibacter mobilis]QJD75196.1 efflux RND transporter periplasmic adaptor subunit [Pyruvatibacter mobilis]GGD13566.1 hemolysin D [Pyruvatibacter mobilis]